MKNAELTITNKIVQIKVIVNKVRQKDKAALEQGDVDVSLSFKNGIILWFLTVRHFDIVVPFTAQMIPANERFRHNLAKDELLNLTLVLEDCETQIHAVRVVSLSTEFSQCLVDVLAREAAQEWVGAVEYEARVKRLLCQYPKLPDLRAITAIAHTRAGV